MEIILLVLYTCVSLFTRMYKWMPELVGEINLQQTGFSFRRVEIVLSLLMPMKLQISTGIMDHLAVMNGF